jgi:hypothetical protein
MNGEAIRRKAFEVGEVTALKSEAYGDSAGTAGAILAILWPDGVPVDRYGDMLLVVRVLDKLLRLAHDPGAFGESPWLDVAGYGLVGAARKDGT